jgi:hypothetical protein
MITAAEARAKVILAWSEQELQTHLIGVAESLGWMAYHTHDSRRSQAGYPDLHLIHPVRGISLFRELKSTKGRISPDQKKWAHALRLAGHDFAYWYPVDVVTGAALEQLQAGRNQ